MVSENPDKMRKYLVVIPATNGPFFHGARPYMCLFCLGNSGHLAEGRDSRKIVVAIMAPATYTSEVCEQSS
jgi:hypothetical protein